MGHELRAAIVHRGQIKASQLVPEINRLNEAILHSMRGTLEMARDCGLLLLQMKALCKHGHFESTVEEQCEKLSIRTARRYMAVAQGWDKLIEKLGPGQASQMTITGGLEFLGHQTKPPQKKQYRPCVADLEASKSAPVDGTAECPHGGAHVYDEEACIRCHDPKPAAVAAGEEDAADEAAEPDRAGDQPVRAEPRAPAMAGPRPEVASLMQRVDGMYGVLLNLLAELQAVAPYHEHGEMRDGLSVNYAAFRRWRQQSQ